MLISSIILKFRLVCIHTWQILKAIIHTVSSEGYQVVLEHLSIDML